MGAARRPAPRRRPRAPHRPRRAARRGHGDRRYVPRRPEDARTARDRRRRPRRRLRGGVRIRPLADVRDDAADPRGGRGPAAVPVQHDVARPRARRVRVARASDRGALVRAHGARGDHGGRAPSRARRADRRAVLLPATCAVLGGTFVHVPQIVVALVPALVYLRPSRRWIDVSFALALLVSRFRRS